MENRLNTSIYNLRKSPIRVFNQLAKEKPGCISLTLGEPDFDTPMSIKSAAAASLENGDTHYIPNNGDTNLLQAISTFEKEKNELNYSPNEIIVTSGATEGLHTALFGIINPGDEIVVPTPAFGLYESIITMCGGIFVPLETTTQDFQITDEMLESVITEKTKAIILNSPSNPTGCILTAESLAAVHKVATRLPIFVICDDVYSQLIYTDKYETFAKYQDIKEKIIVIQSFSKPYAMTGWRMGYLMAEESVKKHLELVHQYTVVSTCSFSQKPCIEALKSDITSMVKTYGNRRDYVLRCLSEMNFSAVTPLGGFYVFPSIEEFGLTSDVFCRRMIAEVGLAATPGFCFGSDKHIRITYCYNDRELEEGMSRLEKFINKLRIEK